MTESRQPEESLIAMAGIMVTEQSLDATLRQLLELTRAAVPGGDEAGVALIEADGPAATIATSDATLRIDRSQYESDAGGPSLEAYRRQEIQRIDATASDERWPQFCAAAAAEGLDSALSVPLVAGGERLGALNLYCRRENGFPAADERVAAMLGSCASVTLANARAYWRAARLASQLQQALSSRGIIDLATGILVAQRGCSPGQAFQMLSAAAQRGGLPLTEVAASLVQRTSHPQQPAEKPPA